TYQVLLGLRQYPVKLTAIVTMSDSGGSSGRLRRDLGILPPGDVRRALMALSGFKLRKNTMNQLFDFRFNNGELAGHSLGNLLLAALTQIMGREDLAISEAAKILEISGQVLPVTTNNTDLIARLKDGTVIRGEKNIDFREIKPNVPIKEVYLSPKGRIFLGAKKAISEANLIVLGPGDLYTSIVPNLLVNGVCQAVARSKAKVIYICNLMTKRGETDKFSVSDFIREIKKYLGPSANKLAVVIVNTKLRLPTSVAKWYKKYKSEPVEFDKENIKGLKIITGSFATSGKFIRHDPQKLSRVMMKLV
ncbi:YvcK family protein, partial [Patescibacteria group bacterium]|nr:YvcK family protein [Patescibacteria group bacterium]